MKKFLLSAILAMGISTNLFASAISGAISGQLNSFVSGKVSNLTDIAESLPGNIGNAFKNLTTDAFGGLWSTMFEGLNYITAGALEKCYTPDTSSSTLNSCSWADKFDDFLQGNFCNLVPNVPGWTKKTEADTEFDWSFGLKADCEAAQAKYGKAISSKMKEISRSNFSVGEKSKKARECLKKAKELVGEKFSTTNLLKLDKDSLAYKAAKSGDNKTIRLIMDFYTNKASNGFELDEANCNINPKKDVGDITYEDIFIAPETINAYNEDVQEAVENIVESKKDIENPIEFVEEQYARAKQEVLEELEANSSETNSTAQVTADAIAKKLLQYWEIGSGTESDKSTPALKDKFNKVADDEVANAIAEYRANNGGLEDPTKDFVDKLKPAYQQAAIHAINKQKSDEVDIETKIRLKYAKREAMIEKLFEKKVILTQPFNQTNAKNEILSYIDCANSTSNACTELLGWN